MTNEILEGLIRANLAGGAAVVAIAIARLPVRRVFGPETAYRLWAAVPMAVGASFLPARIAPIAVRTSLLPAQISGHAASVLVVWLVGVAMSVALLARAQLAFNAAARRGQGGPAVSGVIAPRVIMPADDGRYTPPERDLIRAHERAHMERGDPRAGALAVALQALAWFNPLVHLAGRLMRLDQELACDATVLRRRPRDRALYARTLLKTQLAAQPLPFGCYWPPRGAHPLEVRIAVLKAAPRYESLAGSLLAGAGVVIAAVLAWAAQPPIPALVTPPVEDGTTARAMSVVLLSSRDLPPPPHR